MSPFPNKPNKKSIVNGKSSRSDMQRLNRLLMSTLFNNYIQRVSATDEKLSKNNLSFNKRKIVLDTLRQLSRSHVHKPKQVNSSSNNNLIIVKDVRRPQQQSLPKKTEKRSNAETINSSDPSDYLQEILFETMGRSIKPYAALDNEDFFLDVTAEHVTAYTHDVIAAVREEDIQTLRKMYKDGRTMQCSNRFGESIVHMACRRGSVKVVRFLLEEAQVSFKVKDDYGRTPLHDAFWAKEPEKDLVKMVIQNCPDLLLVSDRRGFTPLSYVRKEHWELWRNFLKDNTDIIRPGCLLSREQQH